MQNLKFFTTAHCSLCERALDLLLATPEMAGYQLESIDIADDPILLERYGDKIPVLATADKELCAPIDRTSLQQWLVEIS
jgi:hypothetical protein